MTKRRSEVERLANQLCDMVERDFPGNTVYLPAARKIVRDHLRELRRARGRHIADISLTKLGGELRLTNMADAVPIWPNVARVVLVAPKRKQGGK